MLGASLMRRLLILSSVVLALGVPFAIGYHLSATNRATTPVALPNVVDEVREALAARYYRAVPPEVLHKGSVDEMISALDDPYTEYLAPQAYKLVREETASSYSGIGVSLLPSTHGFLVVALRPGPAARAGVRVGDVLVEVDGEAATSAADVLGALSDRKKGESVPLTVIRDGHRTELHATLEDNPGPAWRSSERDRFQPFEGFDAFAGPGAEQTRRALDDARRRIDDLERRIQRLERRENRM
jgi:carboxyl-terminal processing protease